MRWCENKGRELGVASPLPRWFGRRVEPYSKFVHAAAAMRDELRFYVARVHGRAVAVTRAGTQPGPVIIDIDTEGLPSRQVRLHSVAPQPF